MIPSQTPAGSTDALPSPAQLVALLAEMRVGITEDEAAALLAMDGPELVAFLEGQGLPIPERLRRLDVGESPAETLSREDVSRIVAPLMSPPGEPKVKGIATDVDAHGSLIKALEGRFAGRIGLIRLEDDGTVTVPLRNAVDGDRDAVADMSRGVAASVVIEPLGGLTYDELEELRTKVSSRLRESELKNWGVGLFGKTQSVYVSLPEEATLELRADIQALARDAASGATARKGDGMQLRASDALVVATGQNEVSEERDNPPQRGGKWITVRGGTCTMGYVVKRTDGAALGMSAGHCAGVRRSGDTVMDANLDQSSNGDVYGTVLANWFEDGNPDIMVWPITNWDGHTRVWLGDGWKTVQGKKPEAQQNSGLNICGTGWGIQSVDNEYQNCDSLDILNYDFTKDLITTPNTNCFERRAREGDSGGPTYALDSEGRALAAGITEGTLHTSLFGFDSYYWCYVTIDNALGVGSYTLPTGK